MNKIILTILITFSLITATVTNTANLTIDEGVTVTFNSDFINEGNITNNGLLQLIIKSFIILFKSFV